MPRSPVAHLVAAFLVLTIAGCAPVGPNYRRPDVATPLTFRFVESQAASFADLPWWQVFEDPVLQALIREAIANNLANYLEILTADQDLFEQQLLLAETDGAELRARAELYRALGGGWQP